MEQQTEKLYVGRGKSFKKITNGWVCNSSVCLDDLFAAGKIHGVTDKKNGKKYLNVDIFNNEKSDNWGNQVSLKVSTFKPNKDFTGKPSTNENDFPKNDDIPF